MVEMGHNHTFCHDLHNHTDIEVRLVWRVMMDSYNVIIINIIIVIVIIIC